MEVIVSIKKNGEFTNKHLEICKSLLRENVFPQFYTNEVFKTLKFEDVYLIDESLILRDGIGSSQSIRYSGKNSEYEKLKTDLSEVGWRLYERPIFVERIEGGKFILIDGRTKDKILNERKFKNRICVVVSIGDQEREKLSNRLNASEDKSPAGSISPEDIVSLAHRQIEAGYINLDMSDITKLINDVCGTGKFSTKKRSELAYQIYHRENSIQNSNLLPISWANNKEVYSWLQRTNYIETPTVVYIPYAASSPMKAVFAAAILSQQKPGKKIRVVIYVSKLLGYDLKKCYIEAVLRFKQDWYYYMDLIGTTYYGGVKSLSDIVELYGCVPSQIEDVCEDMDKLIVFGKNDQKIDTNYLVGQNLTTFFELDDGENDE